MKVQKERYEIAKLDEDVLAEVWKRFNASVFPAFKANKLGVVLFQFQNNFTPGNKAIEHLKYCSSKLDSNYRMAIEFRNRDWISAPHFESTLSLLQSLRPEGVVLVASDDLPHEMMAGSAMYNAKSNTAFNVIDPLAVDPRSLSMPTILTCRSSPVCAYIRVHRRSGSQRLLSDSEMSLWSERISRLIESNTNIGSDSSKDSPYLQGPIYMLWGTDHEDQSIVNARRFQGLVPDTAKLNWYSHYLSNASVSKGLGLVGKKRPAVEETGADTLADSEVIEEVGCNDGSNSKQFKCLTDDTAGGDRNGGGQAVLSVASPNRKSILNYFNIKK